MAAQPRNGHDSPDTNPVAAATEAGRQMCEPAVKAMARSNAEMVSLASRRTQAYMELPARLGACRTPQEVMAEQARFAQTAWTQYAECATRMMAVYQSLAPQTAGVMDAWQSAMRMPGMAMTPLPARDYLDDSEDSAGPGERRPGQPRRAA